MNANYLLSTVLCTVSLVFISCNDGITNENDYPTFQIINNTVEVDDLSPYIKSFDTISLDSCDSSLFFTRINKMLISSDNKYYFLSDGGIYCISDEGKSCFRIGNLGRGPGEFLKIYDICLSSDEKYLICLDQNNDALFYDATDGSFWRKVDTNMPQINEGKVFGTGISPYDDNSFSIFSTDVVANNNKCHAFIFTYKGHLSDSLLVQKDFSPSISDRLVLSQNYGNTYYTSPYQGDNISYIISKGVIKPAFKVDFGKYALPHEAYQDGNTPYFNIPEILGSNFYKYPFGIQHANGKYMLSAYGPNQRVSYFVLDEKTGKGLRWKSGDDRFGATLQQMCSDDNYFYFIYDLASDIPEEVLSSGYNPLIKYIYNKIGVLEYNSNPIILRVQFSI